MFEVWGVEVNVLAIILAAFVNIVVGMLWYSPILFGNVWQKLVKIKFEDMKMENTTYLLSTLLALLVATGLNSVLQFTAQVSQLTPVLNIISTSFMITATLIAPALLNEVIYEGRDKKLFLINISHQFVTLLLMSSVLAIFVL